MAWTDACKIEACVQIDKRKEDFGGVRPAIRELSKESGIPQGTLKRWYYPDKCPKNGTPKLEPKPAGETCAISDLQTLIDSGQKFGTIYADPPWPYGNQATRASTDNHYPTMTLADIAALPVSQLTTEQAHLHLWTTNGFLFESKAIIEAWGFEYKSCLVWIKPQMGIGNYWRVSHEFLLLGVKGALTFSEHNEMSWLQHDRVGHSRKPEQVRRIIERVSPGPYLELFGRRTADNWTVWGNQIEQTIFNRELLSVAN
jgi:N6-adenosine-specific RNA methylase IME4